MIVKLVFVLLKISVLFLFDFIFAFIWNHSFNPWTLQSWILFLSGHSWTWILSNSLLRRKSERDVNREEEGDGGTQGHRDIETWVVTKYNEGQAEVPVLFTGFFLNKLYQGNADEVHYVT